MPTKFILALACCFPFPVAAQVTVTGTWKADDVAFPPWTFVLKADGNKLSGAVSQGRSDPATSMMTSLVQAVEITEGALDGNRLSFKVNAPTGNAIAFSGVVNGDTITFTREVVSGSSGLNGIFGAKGASSFTAKFASTSTEIQAPRAAAALASAGSVNTGVRVVFLGTGTPIVDPDRSGPAVAVVAGGKAYLVDAGPGVVRRASSAARATGLAPLSPIAITTLFLTHLHSDHTLGYPDLIFTPAVTGRRTPLEVYGPKGTQDMTDHLLAAWKKDIDVRVNGLEHGNPDAYKVNVHEIKPGQVYQDANIKVTAFLVKHGSWDEAFGYRFDGANRRVVISGDTSPTPAIADACSGCDVLAHEVYCGAATPGSYNAAFHTAAAELIDIAKQARPKVLVLYHQLYGGCTDAALMEQVQAGFNGAVVSAKDFDTF
jgi:ribonuclease BN (tRNA processing enzyme)